MSRWRGLVAEELAGSLQCTHRGRSWAVIVPLSPPRAPPLFDEVICYEKTRRCLHRRAFRFQVGQAAPSTIRMMIRLIGRPSNQSRMGIAVSCCSTKCEALLGLPISLIIILMVL